MISKKLLMLLAILFGMSITVQAQIVTDPEDEVDEEDEIVVTDQSGKEEVIEFPEAMTYDLDSLLNEYMAKTYLTTNDCNMKNENPYFPEEVYIERLSRMPTIMEWHIIMSYSSLSTAMLPACVAPSPIALEQAISICPSLRRHWKPTRFLWS